MMDMDRDMDMDIDMQMEMCLKGHRKTAILHYFKFVYPGIMTAGASTLLMAGLSETSMDTR
jgi:hypothetical protein